MGLGTSLGYGIALRSGNRKDYVSKIGENYAKQAAARQKAAADADKEASKQINKLAEKFTFTDWNPIPLYANKVEKESADAIQAIFDLKRSGASMGTIIAEASARQQKLRQLQSMSDYGRKIIEDKEHLVPAGYREILMDRNADIADLTKFNNTDLGIVADPDTWSISFNFIPRKIEAPKLEPNVLDEKDSSRKGYNVQNTYYEPVISYTSDDRIKDAASAWRKNPDVMKWTLFQSIYGDTPIEEIGKYNRPADQDPITWATSTGLDKKVEDISVGIVAANTFTKANPKYGTIKGTKPSPRGYGKGTKETPMPYVTFIDRDQEHQSDWKGVDQIAIDITGDETKTTLKVINPNVNFPDLGGGFIFYPNTAKGGGLNELSPGENYPQVYIEGVINHPDDLVILKNRGKQTVSQPNTIAKIPYDLAESAFVNSLGGGDKGRMKAWKWYAEMYGIKSKGDLTGPQLNDLKRFRSRSANKKYSEEESIYILNRNIWHKP